MKQICLYTSDEGDHYAEIYLVTPHQKTLIFHLTENQPNQSCVVKLLEIDKKKGLNNIRGLEVRGKGCVSLSGYYI